MREKGREQREKTTNERKKIARLMIPLELLHAMLYPGRMGPHPNPGDSSGQKKRQISGKESPE